MPKKTLEYRTTVRFPPKDWEFLEDLVLEGEFCCPSDAIREAVKEYRTKREKQK